MGSWAYTVTDSEGIAQIVQFDTPIPTTITVTIDVTGSPVVADVKDEVELHFDEFNIGEMPTIGGLYIRLLENVAGIGDITSIVYNPPSVASLNRAVTDAAHINVI